MSKRFWIPALAATALLLSACGDDEAPDGTTAKDAPTKDAANDTPTEQQAPAEQDAPAEQETPAVDANGSNETTAAEADGSTPAVDSDTQPVSAGEASGSVEAEQVKADDDTLTADPEDVLNDDDAMPGEVTESDVDQVINDIDKRFEKAEEELKAQFEEAEEQEPSVKPLPGAEAGSDEGDVTLPESELSLDEPSAADLPESSLNENGKLDGELGKSEVDDLIEDAERRFEETQDRLQEQFEELEQEDVETAPETLQPMSGAGDSSERSGE